MTTIGALIRLVTAELRVRPGRLAALTATMALGATVLTTAFVLGSSLREAADSGVRVALRGADVVITSESVNAVDETVSSAAANAGANAGDLKKIAAIDGVQQISHYQRTIAAAQAGDEARGITIESLADETSFQWQAWTAGRPPQAGGEIALTQHTLDQLRIGLGDRVAIGRPEVGRAVFTVVGIVDTRGATAYGNSGYGVTTATVARRLAGLETDASNVVMLRTENGADSREVVHAANSTAPVGFAQTVDDLISSGTSVEQSKVAAVSAVITAFALLALVVAAVVVSTTTTVGLAARLKAIALQRCVGASRRQIFAQIVGEVIVVGLAGAVIGCLVGILLGRLALPLASLVPGLPDVADSAFTVRLIDIVTVLALILGLCLLAGLVPAFRASRVRPVVALQSAPDVASRSRSRAGAGLRIAAVGAAILVGLVWLEEANTARGMAGAVALLTVGTLAALGVILRLAASAGLRLLPTGRAPATRLALADIATQPRRAAAEGVAIAMAVTIAAITWVTLASISSSLGQRLDSDPTPDLVLGTGVQTSPISDDAVSELKQIDGVAAAVSVPFGRDITLRGRDGKRRVSISTGTSALTTADFDEALHQRFAIRQMRDDTVYLPQSVTPPFNADASIRMQGEDGTVRNLSIEYVEDLSSSVVTPTLMRRVSKETEVRNVWLRLDSGADRARIVEEASAIGVLAGPVPVGGPAVADLRIERALAAARATATALLAVSVLVAVIGAAATAAAAVSESGRDHALLRALGLDRTGLRRMLALRSILVGGLSALTGAALGTIAGSAVARLIGESVDLPDGGPVAWWPIALAVMLVMLIVRAAAAVPLEGAVQVSPARALAAP